MKKLERIILICIILSGIILYVSKYLIYYQHPSRVNREKINNNIIVISSSSLISKFANLENYSCKNASLHKKNIQWNNLYWQKVDRLPVFLLSAYYDSRTSLDSEPFHYVRLISSATGNAFQSVLYCQFWLGIEHLEVTTVAEPLEIWVNLWNKNTNTNLNTYRSALLSCPIPTNVVKSNVTLKYISISTDKCQNASNKLLIKHNKLSDRNKIKLMFAVCVKSLNFDYDISERLIEWIELNLFLGAQKIFIYEHYVHPNVKKVLDLYTESNVVVVIPMTLPGVQPNEPSKRTDYIRKNLWQKRRNELVPYNDCLYRNIYDYQFIIPLDIDEVIVPVKESNWKDMLDAYMSKESESAPNYASLSVKNVYFFEQFGHQNASIRQVDSKIPQNFFHMLKHQERSANFSQPGFSVKSFIYTNRTLTVFNHYALQTLFLKTKKTSILSDKDAQMNHYKQKCPRNIYSQCKNIFLKSKVTDDILKKYESELVKRIERIYRYLYI